eukprot:216072_1
MGIISTKAAPKKNNEQKSDNHNISRKVILEEKEELSYEMCELSLDISFRIKDLLSRNFDGEDDPNHICWYLAIQEREYYGIVLKQDAKININEIETTLISGLFWKHMNYSDNRNGIYFTKNDFDKYMNNQTITQNKKFTNYKYDSNGYNHMICTKHVLANDSKQVFTKKGFEYKYNVDRNYFVKHNDDEYIYASFLCTDAQYRNKGISFDLIQTFFISLPKGSKIGYHVKANNVGAQHLYFKCGFQHIDTVNNFYDNKTVDAWKMVLIL